MTTEQLQKAQFAFHYSAVFAPYLREVLSRTPKSAFKLPKSNALELSCTNPLDNFVSEQRSLLPWLNVPWQVRVCVDRIYELGLGSVAKGIFRVPGSTNVINAMFDKLEHAELPDLTDSSVGIEEVSGLLKKLIRERFKDDLFESDLVPSVVAAAKQEDIPALKSIILKQMNCYNMAFLKEIFMMLRLTADEQEQNMMDVNNLATIFGEMLEFLSTKIPDDVRLLLCKLLIQNYHDIFGDHSSLQQYPVNAKNVPVYLDDGSKKAILISGTETADSLKNKAITKAKTSGTTFTEEVLARSVLCELGDREIQELSGDTLVGKRKAFLLTDIYNPSKVLLGMKQKEQPREPREPKELPPVPTSSAHPPQSLVKTNSQDGKGKKEGSESKSKDESSRDGSNEDRPRTRTFSRSRTHSVDLNSKPGSMASSSALGGGSQGGSPRLSAELDPEARASVFQEPPVESTIEITRWLNSISEISEINNSTFSDALKQQGYVYLGSLLAFQPTVQQLVRAGIPIYFANLIHHRANLEIQNKKVKRFQNSISNWFESLSVPSTYLTKFTSAGYTNLQSVLSFPPTESQLVDLEIPLLHVIHILREFTH